MIFSQFCFNNQQFSNLCEVIIGIAYFEACISSVVCLSLHPGSWSGVGWLCVMSLSFIKNKRLMIGTDVGVTKSYKYLCSGIKLV